MRADIDITSRLTRYSEVMAEPAPTHLASSEVTAMRAVAQWAVSYLCQPHPDLGREGPVCPFTRPSLERDIFWLTVCDVPTMAGSEVYEATRALAETFVHLEPTATSESRYKTVLVVFPRLVDKSEVDDLQRRLKPTFVQEGLMVGQFHDECDEPGLWNPNFPALRSPLPLLAIRHMVTSDFAFLTADPAWIASYLAKFAPEVPGHVRKSMVELIGKKG